jgi:hypothetical protein
MKGKWDTDGEPSPVYVPIGAGLVAAITGGEWGRWSVATRQEPLTTLLDATTGSSTLEFWGTPIGGCRYLNQATLPDLLFSYFPLAFSAIGWRHTPFGREAYLKTGGVLRTSS